MQDFNLTKLNLPSDEVGIYLKIDEVLSSEIDTQFCGIPDIYTTRENIKSQIFSNWVKLNSQRDKFEKLYPNLFKFEKYNDGYQSANAESLTCCIERYFDEGTQFNLGLKSSFGHIQWWVGLEENNYCKLDIKEILSQYIQKAKTICEFVDTLKILTKDEFLLLDRKLSLKDKFKILILKKNKYLQNNQEQLDLLLDLVLKRGKDFSGVLSNKNTIKLENESEKLKPFYKAIEDMLKNLPINISSDELSDDIKNKLMQEILLDETDCSFVALYQHLHVFANPNVFYIYTHFADTTLKFRALVIQNVLGLLKFLADDTPSLFPCISTMILPPVWWIKLLTPKPDLMKIAFHGFDEEAQIVSLFHYENWHYITEEKDRQQLNKIIKSINKENLKQITEICKKLTKEEVEFLVCAFNEIEKFYKEEK